LKAVWFERTITVLIVITTVLMAMDSPIEDPQTEFKQAIMVMGNVITGVYAVESILKIFCYGFIFNEGAYLRDVWNLIDFVSIVITLSSLLVQNNLDVFKALRSFRILKQMASYDNLKLVLISLGRSRVLILKLIIFAFSYLVCYGLLAVKFHKGSFRRCVNFDPSVTEMIITRQDCFDYGGDWIKADFHYDNIIAAVYNLFIIATCEGWNAF
jgi:Ion transport protein